MEIKNLLVVDDEESIRELLKQTLEIFGFKPENIFVAKDGMEAMEVIEAKEINLIISDNDMPRSSGLDLLKKVKQNYNHILFILISGYDIRHEAELADAFLLKPIFLQDLKEVLQDLKEGIEKIRQ